MKFYNEQINKKYIEHQNLFCDNQSKYFNAEFENKIQLANVTISGFAYKMYVYQKDDVVSDFILKTGNWEGGSTIQLQNALNYYSQKKNIKKENIYALDIGANIGWYSFYLSKLGYKVIGFEPSSINYYILRKNYCLNREANLTIIKKGLYNKEKKCGLYSETRNKGNGMIICDKGKNVIPNNFIKNGEFELTKLSNYVDFLSNNNLALIKIDIEGAEEKGFKGGLDLITKYHIPFILMEFCPAFLKLHDTVPLKFLRMFKSNGYQISNEDFFSRKYVNIHQIAKADNNIINLYITYKKFLNDN